MKHNILTIKKNVLLINNNTLETNLVILFNF